MTKDTVQFSPREMETLALAWQCMESQPKIDMTKLARLTGYTPGSASVTFGNIKRKLKILGEGLAAEGPATPKNGAGAGKPKASSTKRGSKRAAGTSEEDDNDTTPSKKAKKNAPKKNRMDDDDDDEEMLAPRIKKEELADVMGGANTYFDQLQNAAGEYDFEQGVGSDD